ncbi:MAG TPA: aspartyl/asparaginyl beta-hydroxylase domain-containing protein [Xanthobacteraceae bacterium]|nr:aspartyl/asparaginyl beta-hydroxylase domain-containing protein [Xanthobacteraceae bacterium]
MFRAASELGARISLKELYRRAIKLPMKKLGHAIEDWVAAQSPFGNSSIIDTNAFEWVERLEKNSGVIRQELMALLSEQLQLPNIQELSPRQMNLSKADGWKTYFFYLLGHRIEESYRRCPETGKLLDSIPGLTLAFFSVLAPGMHIKRHRGAWKGVVRCHLGLIVPEPRTAVRMQVGDEMIYWEEGKCVIFDDTHKHEVWNETDGIRVVLLLDVHRPLPRWLTRVNKALLGLAYYAPEVRRLVRMQREWEAQSKALASSH